MFGSNAVANFRKLRVYLCVFCLSAEVVRVAHEWLTSPASCIPYSPGISEHRRNNTANATISTCAVFATALGYNKHHANIFLGSLRKTGYTGDIHLIVGGNETRDVLKTMQFWNATLHYSNTAHRNLVEKFMVAADICKPWRYQYCLVVDYRDVFFQLNPFDRYPAGTDLVFFEESRRSRRIGDNHPNGPWLRNCLGAHILLHPNQILTGLKEYPCLRQHYIICAGTLSGTPLGLSWLAKQYKAFEPEQLFRYCDQSLLNVIAGRLLLNPVRASASDLPYFAIQIDGYGGMVHTMAFAKVFQNAQGFILEDDNVTLSALVHQYDRHPELIKFARQKFGKSAWAR